MNPQTAKEIIERYNSGNCTAEEKLLVASWEAALENTGDIAADAQKLEQWQHIIQLRIQAEMNKEAVPVHTLPQRHFIKKWWVAAIFFLCIAGGSFFLYTGVYKKGPSAEIAQTQPGNIVAPDKNKASITLADGTVLYLDSAGNGQLAQQGGVQLVKLANGQIAYQLASGKIVKELQYNTLNNPRGSKVIDMLLADGTHVWLNAGSSVTYPVAFAGQERKVSITGEAYFEVAHDNTKPFYVNKGTMEVEVLGTHFNVNAYDDEPDIKVTLLEGGVKVYNGQNTAVLKPGEQVSILHSAFTIHHNADTEQVMAWKNGLFNFQNTDLKTVMRQIARWYNVDVIYEGKIPDLKFGGDITRDLSLQQVLLILKDVEINCRVDDKTIIVTN